jgi:diguanylate cyclase (GGDEF)-like protein/PAS domain S-box-containing protein
MTSIRALGADAGEHTPASAATQVAAAALHSLQRLLTAAVVVLVVVAIVGMPALWVLRACRGRVEAVGSAAAEVARDDDAVSLYLPSALASGNDGPSAIRLRLAATKLDAALQALGAASHATGVFAVIGSAADRVVAAGHARMAVDRHMLAVAARGQAISPTKDVPCAEATAHGLVALSAVDEAQLHRLNIADRSAAASAIGLAGICALILALRGPSAGRHLTSWRRVILAHVRDQERQAEQLRTTGDRLEHELRDRTAELMKIRHDLEEQVSLRRGSDAERQLLTQAVQSANDVVMITYADEDVPPRVVYINSAFERMTGYTTAEILGRSPKMLQGANTDPATLEYIRARLRARESVQAELLNYRRDGSTFWVELNIRPIRNETGFQTHWISIQRDVTERKQAEERIRWQATHDSLTNLPNRALYQERLAEAVVVAEQTNSCIGVLFFDLDRFKQINDTLGHTVGDHLLQEVSARLQKLLRREDTIARIGGDEFAVLLPYRDLSAPEVCGQQAEEVAQRLLDVLDEAFHVDGHELYVTASIGICIAPQDGNDIETLLRRADTAMYRAKDQGRDSYRLYTHTMGVKDHDRLVLETALRRALEREEFFLLYQPQVDLATGRIFGVEALLRWENPQLGMISPGQFIGIAEETGLIVPIGEWALRQACHQAVLWQDAGWPLRLSVNLSARQFQQQDLVLSVATILQECGLEPEWLDLELTESTLLSEKEAKAILIALKAFGVRLSVDDFGTGYSQFSYLRTFPFDVLKIDRSFIIDLLEDRKSEAVVRNLIGMAHDVGLEVIVEGVETELQRTALLSMGCEAVQGYLFSPPTTSAEVLRLTREAARRMEIASYPPVPNAVPLSPGSYPGGDPPCPPGSIVLQSGVSGRRSAVAATLRTRRGSTANPGNGHGSGTASSASAAVRQPTDPWLT